MGNKIKIRVQRPWIGYPSTTLQQNYAESIDEHGYLLWDISNDNNKLSYDVKFKQLSNPCPFVTLTWDGDDEALVKEADTFPNGSRFRINCEKKIMQENVQFITSRLSANKNAKEVVYNDVVKHNIKELTTKSGKTIIREDLRNIDVLSSLVKEHLRSRSNKLSDEKFQSLVEQLKQYLQDVPHNTTPRNVNWSLDRLEFNNTFAYGEDNVINFENLSGIIGLFGANRSGKSSIPGTMMYALYNGTDRGSVKNQHVCNVRRDDCSTNAYISVNSKRYVIKRKTRKHDRNGDVFASTSLNMFELEGKEEINMTGEQRSDTDETIRNLIGTQDDFMLTSFSAQGGTSNFLNIGSSKRWDLLTRYLDIDVMHKIYDAASTTVSSQKNALKLLGDDADNFEALLENNRTEYDAITTSCSSLEQVIEDTDHKISKLRNDFKKLSGGNIITKSDIEKQISKLSKIQSSSDQLTSTISELETTQTNNEARLKRMSDELEKHDINKLKSELSSLEKLTSTIQSLSSKFDAENKYVQSQKRSLEVLNQVPCGDEYSSCKFIKDAYKTKESIGENIEKALETKKELKDAKKMLADVDVNDKKDFINKLQKLIDAKKDLTHRIEKTTSEIQNKSLQLEHIAKSIVDETTYLEHLQSAFDENQSKDYVKTETELNALQKTLTDSKKKLDSLKEKRLRLELSYEDMSKKLLQRNSILQKLAIHELISQSFSKTGIPNDVVMGLLPIINNEINTILGAVCNFTVELIRDENNNKIDVFIDYGDSKRPLELGSGMEKMMSSIAIRAALISVSTLPKPNFFIIDEGFGAFDDAGVESCSKLLKLLKDRFKMIIIITHVDSIKDTADTVLEISKMNDSSRIVYE